MTAPRERIIVGLDLPNVEEAERIVAALGEDGRFYKIGYQLIPIGGLDLAQRLSARGRKTFLDFKFHDIGATVERGTQSVAKLGADFLTVHAEAETLKGAIAGRGDDARLKILAVTVLTNQTQQSLAEAGVAMKLEDLVLKRAALAAKAGADGVVASAAEAAAIRARFGKELLVVTPGVRPRGAAAHDQKRVATPAEAIRAGADYLVIGRPIAGASEPAKAFRVIADEIAAVQR
jgi:orotidine-5'-phosphate decarboxylase